jgi:hypothetical protein
MFLSRLENMIGGLGAESDPERTMKGRKSTDHDNNL